MKRGTIYLFTTSVLVVLIYSCSPKIQTYNLDEEYAVSMHIQPSEVEEKSEEEASKDALVGIPVKNFYGGDLKRGAIWWAGKGIILEKGDVFVINATNIGPENTPFGATFPPLDFTKEDVMLKVTARSEGLEGAVPTLYMQVADANGYQTNAKRPSNKIEASENFVEYYFDMKGIYEQSQPEKHKVNGAMINSLKFFINPGETAFTGKIFIQEIKVVPAPKN